MHSLRIRCAWLLTIVVGIGASLLTPVPALAGNINMVHCDHCLTVNDMKAWAGHRAATVGYGGIFMVVSRNNPLTGYIRVSGQRATTCTPNGECTSYFKILNLSSVTSGGSPAGTGADLSMNDTELFGTQRAERIPPVRLSPNYQSSIINSDDAEVGPGISAALVAMGINPASIPIGTIVTVQFQDGTKATFVKVSSSTYMWGWTGQAWDADGNPINRDGTQKSNPNTTGASGGGLEYSTQGRDGSQIVYSMTTSTKCIKVVSISVNGIRWGSWYGWASCP